jgi:hypothetical protein
MIGHGINLKSAVAFLREGEIGTTNSTNLQISGNDALHKLGASAKRMS